jgi:hypothetical protein
VAVRVVFLAMVLLVVLVGALQQLITQLFTRAALAILLPPLHRKEITVVLVKELMALTKPEEEAVERLLLEQTV